MNGEFRWQGGIDLDTDHLMETKANWNMRNRCRFSEVPADADPEQFRTQFSLNVPDYDGQPLEVRTGPGSVHWTPLQEMSPYMESAVLTTEDGGFYNHHGFDSGAIEGAIKSNMESGKFTRGASTISMQLAKNLYLERDKYIARKIQEALLTMLLEQELTKREILSCTSTSSNTALVCTAFARLQNITSIRHPGNSRWLSVSFWRRYCPNPKANTSRRTACCRSIARVSCATYSR